jgi:hypothetical protein
MRHRRLLTTALLALLLLPQIAAPAPALPYSPATLALTGEQVEVLVTDSGFVPASVLVPLSGSVLWRNQTASSVTINLSDVTNPQSSLYLPVIRAGQGSSQRPALRPAPGRPQDLSFTLDSGGSQAIQLPNPATLEARIPARPEIVGMIRVDGDIAFTCSDPAKEPGMPGAPPALASAAAPACPAAFPITAPPPLTPMPDVSQGVSVTYSFLTRGVSPGEAITRTYQVGALVREQFGLLLNLDADR